MNDENLLQCLQNVTTEELKKVFNMKQLLSIWYGPSVDNEFIADDPHSLWKNGMVKNCDIIMGITKDEMFFSQWPLIINHRSIDFYLEHFQDVLRSHFGNASEEVYEKARALYEPKCVPSYIEALRSSVNFESDRYFICPTRNEVLLRNKIFTGTNVFLYRYSHIPLMPYLPQLYPYGTFGFAAHGLDIIVSC